VLGSDALKTYGASVREDHSLFQFVDEFVDSFLIGEAPAAAVRKKNLNVVGLLNKLHDMGDVYRFAALKLDKRLHAASVLENPITPSLRSPGFQPLCDVLWRTVCSTGVVGAFPSESASSSKRETPPNVNPAARWEHKLTGQPFTE
jgi:hypothetical protein